MVRGIARPRVLRGHLQTFSLMNKGVGLLDRMPMDDANSFVELPEPVPNLHMSLTGSVSCSESTVMDVFNSVVAITDSEVPAYLQSTVNGADAEQALPDTPSMPEFMVMDVYNSVSAITDSGSQRTRSPP